MGRPPAAQRTGPALLCPQQYGPRANSLPHAFRGNTRAGGRHVLSTHPSGGSRGWAGGAGGSCTAVVPLYHGRLNSSYPTFRINPKLIQMNQLRHSCPTPEVGKNKARPSQTTKHASPDDQSPTSTALTTRTDIEGGGGGEGFVKNSGSTKTARSPWQRKATALT